VDILSVVIPTYRRHSYLAKALDSLVEQSLAKTDYEVIVVDNACEDEVRVLTLSYAADAQVSYIAEPKVGLSHARNTGLRNVRGEFVVFMDDDAVAAPGWLEAVMRTFSEGGSTVAAVGGPITLLWEEPRPTWLADALQGVLGYLDHGPATRLLAEGEWLWGGNMAFRARSLAEVGGFPANLGREGNRKHLISSEEVIVQARLADQGFLRVYNPAALVSHAVAADRVAPGWFLRRYYWQGVSTAIMARLLEQPSGMRRLRRIGRYVSPLLRQPNLFRALVLAMVRRQSTVRLEERCKALWYVGMARGWVRPIRLAAVRVVNEQTGRT
jgi:glycosyltransferase involved in cell wall biosynthesis